ncbi:hypothetical protein LZ31DRAFT_160306 [Colletotrichum somersetense]|nr:hypothetical protein LZ31DRAFT_160306 [Colletotrichum somersetense]
MTSLLDCKPINVVENTTEDRPGHFHPVPSPHIASTRSLRHHISTTVEEAPRLSPVPRTSPCLYRSESPSPSLPPSISPMGKGALLHRSKHGCSSPLRGLRALLYKGKRINRTRTGIRPSARLCFPTTITYVFDCVWLSQRTCGTLRGTVM